MEHPIALKMAEEPETGPLDYNNEMMTQMLDELTSQSPNKSIFQLLAEALKMDIADSDAPPNDNDLPPILQAETEFDNNFNGIDSNWTSPRRRQPKGKEEERRRQMAKNREYARKCVQKKKDQRREAEIRCKRLVDQINSLKNTTEYKERNAGFAVDLLTMSEEIETKNRTDYEKTRAAAVAKWQKLEARDETVNINYCRLEDAKEEFKKASDDLRDKRGVIGTLGSRKIRAKQHMEWRTHLYQISLYEHQLAREKDLSKLADEYVRSIVPRAAPLVKAIPKQLLNDLIQLNRTAQLEEFIRFVENYQEVLFAIREGMEFVKRKMVFKYRHIPMIENCKMRSFNDKMSNNRNDDIDELSVGDLNFLGNAADLVPEQEIAAVGLLPMYPVISDKRSVPTVGNDEIRCEIDMFDQEEKPRCDISLSELHCPPMDVEEKEFFDLDHQMTPKASELCPREPIYEPYRADFQPCTKYSFHYSQQLQSPTPAFEVQFGQSEYRPYSDPHEFTLSPSELLSPFSSPASPAFTVSDLPIGDVRSNNSNESSADMRTRGGRKMSVCSVKSEKSRKFVAYEKPTFRARRTKADMEAMTEEDRKLLKMEQNRKNASNCVARRKEAKEKMKIELPGLKEKLEKLTIKNEDHERQIRNAYANASRFDNNAPYGMPEAFYGLIESQREEVFRRISEKQDGHIHELKLSYTNAQDKYNAVMGQDMSNVKQATFASQKSRANGEMLLAELFYKTAVVNRDIEKEKVFEEHDGQQNMDYG
ncbi:unnamed protein product [Caenorhabditis sp. 36 PRJEB53466]|nr:unnamed protein product [Caenorhabditis sp. 36 PRJEB53466]